MSTGSFGSICINYIGPTGPTGATGSTGPTGPQQVLINRTLFVDPFYGSNVTAVPNDMTKPYSDLITAHLAANPLDIIYVQPGDYILDSPIELGDQINWFFSEGANVTSNVAYMFTDSLGPVTCNITGYGNFSAAADAGPILSTFNNSNISFTATKIQSNSLANLGVFDLSNTVSGISQNVVINVQSVSRTIPVLPTFNGSIITVGSNGTTNVNVQFTSQWCESLNTIIALAGTGCLQFNSQIVVAGSSLITGDNNYLGPMISNQTDAYKIFVNTQTSISKSLTQAIQTVNPGLTGGTGDVGPNSIISLTSQTIQCAGGLLYAVGAILADDINDQPHVTILSTDVSVNLDPTANNIGIHVDNAYVTAEMDTYIGSTISGPTGPTGSAYNVEIINGGYITIDSDLIMCDTSRLFRCDNTLANSKLTSLVVTADTISCSTTLLNSNNACRVNITSQYIMSYSTSNIPAITSTGLIPGPPPVTALTAGLYIKAEIMILGGMGLDALNKVNVIDILAGSLCLNVDTYGVDGSFYNAIHIGSDLNVNFLSINVAGIIAADSRFLYAEGAVDCNIGIIAGGIMDGGAGMTLIEASGNGNNGGITGKINSLIVLGSGIGLLTSGSGHFNGEIGTIQFIGGADTGTPVKMIDGSDINGIIMNIGSNAGPAIDTSSTGNMHVTFQKIDCNSADIALNFTGTGDVRLIGGGISTQTVGRIIYITGKAQLSLICENIFANKCKAVVYTEKNAQGSGSAFIDFQQISVNTATEAVFYSSNERMNLKGMTIYADTTNTLIHCLDGTNFALSAQTLGANNLSYIAKVEQNCNATINVLEINANNLAIDGFNMDSANQLRVSGDVLYIGGTGMNHVINADNNGLLFFDVKQIQINAKHVNVISVSNNSSGYINFDRLNTSSGTSLISCVSSGNVQITGQEIQSNVLEKYLIEGDLTNLTMTCQSINVNTCFSVIRGRNDATINLQYLSLSAQLLSGGIAFDIDSTRLVSINGQNTDLNTVGTGSEPAFTISNGMSTNQQFYGEFNRFSLNGGLMPCAIVTDGGNANFKFNYLYSQGSCLHTASNGTVTFVATQAISNSTNPCITILTPNNANIPITVGGYLSSTPALHTIQWQTGSYPTPLRVLPSTLLCDGSAESIYCDISINPTASVSPSIATTAASANVNVIPTGTIFVDSGIF